MAEPMTIRQYWWIAVVSAIVAIVFGVLALIWPGLTLSILVLLFGVYAIVYGLVELGATLGAASTHTTWWPHLLVGLLSIGAGVLSFAYPDTTGVALVYIIGFWAVCIGVVQIIAAFLTNLLAPAISGLIAVLFGLLLISNPGVGALALVMLIGIFAIVLGIVQLTAAVRAQALFGARR
ncbi:MAG: HdeD family acid-resistance protein [Chloroflexota bacterium]|nr:MAG: HdeD family acid-resistance protein [Chloroflexota bacterium]